MYTTTTYRTATEINSAMGRVYSHMFMAVITSMIVSFFVGTNPALIDFFFTGIVKWIVIFAPLAAVFGVSVFLNTNPPKFQSQLALHGFAALMGLSFATIFAIFTVNSIFSAFMGAAVLFASMSFYGYFTKKDLTSIGKFFFIGLISIIIVSIINLFLGSSILQMTLSALAVIVFLGLTAYDTQNIREMVSSENVNDSQEVLGALSLYINFINIFLSLLQLFGSREE